MWCRMLTEQWREGGTMQNAEAERRDTLRAGETTSVHGAARGRGSERKGGGREHREHKRLKKGESVERERAREMGSGRGREEQ